MFQNTVKKGAPSHRHGSLCYGIVARTQGLTNHNLHRRAAAGKETGDPSLLTLSEKPYTCEVPQQVTSQVEPMVRLPLPPNGSSSSQRCGTCSLTPPPRPPPAPLPKGFLLLYPGLQAPSSQTPTTQQRLPINTCRGTRHTGLQATLG